MDAAPRERTGGLEADTHRTCSPCAPPASAVVATLAADHPGPDPRLRALMPAPADPSRARRDIIRPRIPGYVNGDAGPDSALSPCGPQYSRAARTACVSRPGARTPPRRRDPAARRVRRGRPCCASRRPAVPQPGPDGPIGAGVQPMVQVWLSRVLRNPMTSAWLPHRFTGTETAALATLPDSRPPECSEAPVASAPGASPLVPMLQVCGLTLSLAAITPTSLPHAFTGTATAASATLPEPRPPECSELPCAIAPSPTFFSAMTRAWFPQKLTGTATGALTTLPEIAPPECDDSPVAVASAAAMPAVPRTRPDVAAARASPRLANPCICRPLLL